MATVGLDWPVLQPPLEAASDVELVTVRCELLAGHHELSAMLLPVPTRHVCTVDRGGERRARVEWLRDYG